MLMFLLKRLDPELRDPPKVALGDALPPFVPMTAGQSTTVTQTMRTTVKVETLSDGELEQLKQLLIKAGAQVKDPQKALDAAGDVTPTQRTGHVPKSLMPSSES